MRLVCLTSLFLGLLRSVRGDDRPPFRIQVVDEATGRGVPLVELMAVNDIRSFSASAA